MKVFNADGRLLHTSPSMVSDVAYDEATWNGVTNVAPSKNAVRDEMESHYGAVDPHTGYVLESLIDAASDLFVGTGDNAVGRLAVAEDRLLGRRTGQNIEAISPANIWAFLSGHAGAAVSMNDKIFTALAGMLLTAATELTMDTNGAITVTQMVHTVDTFEDAASDNLDTINGGTTVGLIIIRPAHTDRTVVVRDGQGNIELQGGSDITLDDITDHIMLFWDTTNSKWVDFGGGAAGVAAHAILDGVVHTDSVADAVTKGSLIAGNATPKWDELVVGTDEYSLVAASGQTLGLKWAKRARVTTANTSVYVDKDVVGGDGDGTSWANAYTTIQAAWDGLPDVIAHDVGIYVSIAGTAYAEDVLCTGKFVSGSVTFHAATGSGTDKAYWYGTCAALAVAGDFKVLTYEGADDLDDVEVDDKVLVLNLTGANGRVVDYEAPTVDDISQVGSDIIGTDGAKSPTTSWLYVIFKQKAASRVEVAGTTNCFKLIGADNTHIKGFYLSGASSYAIDVNNSRYGDFYGNWFASTGSGPRFLYMSSGKVYYSYMTGVTYGSSAVIASECTTVFSYISASHSCSYGDRESISYLYNSVANTATRAMYGIGVSYCKLHECLILTAITTGGEATMNSVVWVNRCHNHGWTNATIDGHDATHTDASYAYDTATD